MVPEPAFGRGRVARFIEDQFGHIEIEAVRRCFKGSQAREIVVRVIVVVAVVNVAESAQRDRPQQTGDADFRRGIIARCAGSKSNTRFRLQTRLCVGCSLHARGGVGLQRRNLRLERVHFLLQFFQSLIRSRLCARGRLRRGGGLCGSRRLRCRSRLGRCWRRLVFGSRRRRTGDRQECGERTCGPFAKAPRIAIHVVFLSLPAALIVAFNEIAALHCKVGNARYRRA